MYQPQTLFQAYNWRNLFEKMEPEVQRSWLTLELIPAELCFCCVFMLLLYSHSCFSFLVSHLYICLDLIGWFDAFVHLCHTWFWSSAVKENNQRKSVKDISWNRPLVVVKQNNRHCHHMTFVHCYPKVPESLFDMLLPCNMNGLS